ncbi:hypothetical protein [Haliangium ochraceum]|uniref:hypothetical protein n=1 Tax=Haliangium ochraceum TaxID=80816 RepID=UPI0003039155|nr:hypothetical protein [Haliangium ochraceum]
MGLPAHEIQYYTRELRHEHSMVLVEARGRSLHALTVLDRLGPFERAIFRLASLPSAAPAIAAAPTTAVALG